jgi:hypothetical protein
MGVTDTRPGRAWLEQAEQFLRSLKNIAAANITLSEGGGEILEINILAEGQRAPKQIVRDVRSALKAKYQIEVDYRCISVAQKRDRAGAEAPAPEPTVLALPSAHLEEEPAVARLRYGRISTLLEPQVFRIRVELALGEREAAGEAEGPSSPRISPRLAGEAALDAAAKFLDAQISLVLTDVERIRTGGQEVVLVVMKLYKDRTEKVLTGSAPVDHDLNQAVVYATLQALNRFIGRLRFREPVEYEIRPTSLP